MKEKTNWNNIKTEYVTGKESYRTLAKKHNLSISTLSKMATKYKWADKRKKYRDKLETTTIEKTAKKAANRESNKLIALIDSSNRMADVITRVLDDPEQFFRYVVTEKKNGNSTVKEKTFKKADVKAIREMTTSIRDLEVLIRSLNGIGQSTDIEIKLKGDMDDYGG